MARSHRLSATVSPLAKWIKCRMQVGTLYLLYQPGVFRGDMTIECPVEEGKHEVGGRGRGGKLRLTKAVVCPPQQEEGVIYLGTCTGN